MDTYWLHLITIIDPAEIAFQNIGNLKSKNRFSIRKLLNKRWPKITLFCFSSLSLISWDRVTKDLAKEHLKDKAEYSYFHDSFRLQYVENTGAAMSFADGLSKTTSFWLLGIIPLAFLVLLLVYTIQQSRKMALGKLFALSLIFAGGVGNIIDRLVFDRHVTDFMNVGILSLRTGIFNFADIWITSGVVFLFLVAKKRGNIQNSQSKIMDS